MPSDSHDVEFARFVEAVRPRLARIAHLLCGDWHQAEDLVQIVLTRSYPRWSHICRGGDPEAYVRRALLNALIDERRRPWRREQSVERITDEHLRPTHVPTTEHSANEAVLRALDSLPVRQRAVVILRYVEDLPVSQVALELSISEGTVKSQAARGLQCLREELSLEVARSERRV